MGPKAHSCHILSSPDAALEPHPASVINQAVERTLNRLKKPKRPFSRAFQATAWRHLLERTGSSSHAAYPLARVAARIGRS